jgi:hypothetical protein
LEDALLQSKIILQVKKNIQKGSEENADKITKLLEVSPRQIISPNINIEEFKTNSTKENEKLCELKQKALLCLEDILDYNYFLKEELIRNPIKDSNVAICNALHSLRIVIVK